MTNESFKSIGSVRTFLEYLEKTESIDSIYFRGHTDLNYRSEPSIYRNNGLIENEHKMFRDIITKCPEDFEKYNNTFQKLVKMQHYSLPTRLLDVTKNPLIALYFACLDNEDKTKDGEVILYKFDENSTKYYDSDTVSILSNISKLDESFEFKDFDKVSVEEFNKLQQVVNLIYEIKEEKPYFIPKITPFHINSVICVKPKLENPRIIKQEGAFILFGINIEKKCCTKIPKNHYLKIGDKRIKILHDKKSKILKQLELLGITHATLFPEIDNVSKYIKNKYKKI